MTPLNPWVSIGRSLCRDQGRQGVSGTSLSDHNSVPYLDKLFLVHRPQSWLSPYLFVWDRAHNLWTTFSQVTHLTTRNSRNGTSGAFANGLWQLWHFKRQALHLRDFAPTRCRRAHQLMLCVVHSKWYPLYLGSQKGPLHTPSGWSGTRQSAQHGPTTGARPVDSPLTHTM